MKVFVDACMKPTKLLCVVVDSGEVLVSFHVGQTHNQAEYMAIQRAVFSFPAPILEIYSDSELAVSQINSALGRRKLYKCNNPQLRILLKVIIEEVRLWERAKETVDFFWIPRENNPAGQELERRKKDVS